jgi:hypothetical protein
MEPLSRSFGDSTTDHVTDACLVATIETMGSWKKVTNSRAQSGVSQHHPCPGGIAGYPTNLLVASSNTRLVPEPEAEAIMQAIIEGLRLRPSSSFMSI